MDKWTGIKADRAVVLQDNLASIRHIKEKYQTAGQDEALYEATTTKSEAVRGEVRCG